MNKNSRKILYVSGTRADFGLMKKALFEIEKHPKLKLEIAATGMHLMDEFGKTVNEVRKCGFKVHEIGATYKKDDKKSMAHFAGEFIMKFSKIVATINPDIILVLGDRAEMLGAAIAGVYLSIPVAHIHGGEISATVDNTTRHAITKLSEIHFPATKKSAQRILEMAEMKNRIFVVGAPGLDDILEKDFTPPEIVMQKYGLDLSKPVLIAIQHPVTEEVSIAAKQMRETMEAVKNLSFQSIIVYPNADAGGRSMIKVIERYRKYTDLRIYSNIARQDYIGLMNIANVLIGNSSGGIIEAASFHLPAVNIGTRQQGRERAVNVIDAPYDRNEITAAVKKAVFDKDFRKKVKRCINPYGKGKAGSKIAKILSSIEIREIFQK